MKTSNRTKNIGFALAATALVGGPVLGAFVMSSKGPKASSVQLQTLTMQTQARAEPAKPVQWWYLKWDDECEQTSFDPLASLYKSTFKAGLNPHISDRGNFVTYEDDEMKKGTWIAYFKNEAACDAIVQKRKQNAQKAEQAKQEKERELDRRTNQVLAPYR